MTLNVSHSKLKTWRRCHKAYDYKYNQKLKSRRIKRPLLFGRIVHEMIEAHANGDEPTDILKKYRKESKKMFSAERPEFLQTIEDAELTMEHYFRYYQDNKISFVSLKKKLAEHEFCVPLTKEINLKGKIDAIVRTKDGSVWLCEHKSHKEIPNEEARFKDLQTVMYASVLPQLGVKQVDGVLWDYIRSKPPQIPELLKDGTMSQRNIDTMWPLYLSALKENKLNPKDYKEMEKKLAGRESDFFKRVFMPINPKVSKQLLNETLITAEEILEKGTKDCTRNISRDCTYFCEYEKLCRAELTEMDADFIRSKEYMKEEPNEVEEQGTSD